MGLMTSIRIHTDVIQERQLEQAMLASHLLAAVQERAKLRLEGQGHLAKIGEVGVESPSYEKVHGLLFQVMGKMEEATKEIDRLKDAWNNAQQSIIEENRLMQQLVTAASKKYKENLDICTVTGAVGNQAASNTLNIQ